MKLVRFGSAGAEQPGLIDAQGRIRDVSALVSDFSPKTLTPELLWNIATVDPTQLPLIRDPTRLGPPVTSVGKFIGIGLNYRDHAMEAGLPIPSEPVIFMKASSCIVGSGDSIILPRRSTKTDFEVELGCVIGKPAKYVTPAEALKYVAGYLVVHDVSERSYQLERGGQWDKGKGCDTFGPIGPWLVTTDEVPDPQALHLWLDVNGQPMQRGDTGQMIFSCADLVSYVSEFMTLLPGDIISTGTPCGVGMSRTPPAYLKTGDRVDLGITSLGEQHQSVVDEPAAGKKEA